MVLRVLARDADDERAGVDLRGESGAVVDEVTVDLARLSEPDELNELPEVVEFEPPELDLFDPNAAKTTAKEALELCKRAEAAARAFSPKVTNSDGATYSRVIGQSAFANSGGFSGTYKGTYQSLVVEPMLP